MRKKTIYTFTAEDVKGLILQNVALMEGEGVSDAEWRFEYEIEREEPGDAGTPRLTIVEVIL